MARLSFLIEEATFREGWQDICFQSTNLNLSNISFADDMVIFGQANINNVRNMLQMINTSCKASGQRINFTKSRVIASEVLCSDLEHFLFVEKGLLNQMFGVSLHSECQVH